MTDYSKDPKKDSKVINIPNKDSENHKQLTKVTSAKKRKKGVTERLVTSLVGPDGLPSVGHYLTHDVVLPAIKEIIVNSVTSGINMMMYGPDSAGKRSTTGYYQRGSAYRPNVNYQSSYKQTPTTSTSNVKYQNESRPYHNETRASGFNSEDYILASRDDAKMVLSQLLEQVDDYGWASLADFFDLVGIDSNFTDNNYGWTNLDFAKFVVVRGGYALRLPRLEPLS